MTARAQRTPFLTDVTFIARYAERLIVPLTLLVIWQVLAWLVTDLAVASPAATITGIKDGWDRGWLVTSFQGLLLTALAASSLACALGLLIGFALGRSPFWGAVFEQPILWIYSMPKVILYPILVVMLGLGIKTSIVFGALHGAFPALLIVYNAVRSVPSVYIRSARMYRLASWSLFRQIVLPHTLPAITMALRYGFSLSYIGVIIAQMLGAQDGAGFELVKSMTLHQTPKMFAIITILMVIALVANLVFYKIERWARVHHPESAPH